MRLTAISVFALALVSGAIAFGAIGHETDGRGVQGALAAGRKTSGLRVVGHVDGLYPGAQAKLAAKVKNPNAFPVVLRSLRAKVMTAAPGCGPESLSVGRYRGHRTIAAHRARRVLLGVEMVADAGGACQGATFPLRFMAKAVR
jgi:hypothetical protein